MLKPGLNRLIQLPPALAWLAGGPPGTIAAVLNVQRRFLFRQMPVVFALLLGFNAAKSWGWVAPEGHLRFAVHYLAAAAVLWPGTFASIGIAAWRDARTPAGSGMKGRLRALSVVASFFTAFTTLVLLGLIGYYFAAVVLRVV